MVLSIASESGGHSGRILNVASPDSGHTLKNFTWSFEPDAKRLRREVATNRAVHAVDPIEARFEY